MQWCPPKMTANQWKTLNTLKWIFFMNLHILLQFPYYDACIHQGSKWIKSSVEKFSQQKVLIRNGKITIAIACWIYKFVMSMNINVMVFASAFHWTVFATHLKLLSFDLLFALLSVLYSINLKSWIFNCRFYIRIIVKK